MSDHIYVNRKNASGALDITAHEAIAHVLENQNTILDDHEADKRVREMYRTVTHMLHLAGFEMLEAFGVMDKKTGREYWF